MAEKIIDDCKPCDLKITKEIHQIEQLISRFSTLNITQKLTSYKLKKGALEDEFAAVDEISEDISQQQWFIKKLEQIQIASDPKNKANEGIRQPTAEEVR